MTFLNSNQYSSPFITASRLSALVLLLALTACSSGPTRQTDPLPPAESPRALSREEALLVELLAAEEQASESGRKVLVTGREITLGRKEVVRGSCWDFTNTVYLRTGYPNTKTCRMTVFKGNKNKGPYAEAELIQPGDWLYYINHSYNDIEHSAIFIKWIDFDERIALMLSYGGEKRKEPARYLPYDLRHVYQIVRPAQTKAEQLVSR